MCRVLYWYCEKMLLYKLPTLTFSVELMISFKLFFLIEFLDGPKVHLWGIGCQATAFVQLSNKVKTALDKADHLKLILSSQSICLIPDLQMQVSWWAPIFSNRDIVVGEANGRKHTLVSATNTWKLICIFMAWLCVWAHFVPPGNQGFEMLEKWEHPVPLSWWRCLGLG